MVRRAAVLVACLLVAMQPRAAGGSSPDRNPLVGLIPFVPTSFWNIKHNDRTITDPMSDTWIAALKAAVGTTKYIKLAGTESDGGGTPYYAVPSSGDPPTPTKVVCNDPDGACYGFNGPSYWLRMPRNARPANDNDSEMVVFDLNLDTNVVVWLYRACPPHWVNAFCTDDGSKDTFTAYSISVETLPSSGIDGCWPSNYPLQFPPPPLGPNDTSNRGHRGIPGAINAVRYDEVVAGLIAHTLKIAIPDPKANTNYFPMAASENDAGDIPEGLLIRIKPSIDIHDSKYGLNGFALVIAKALQDYGAVIGDTSPDTANLKVEDLIVENSPLSWHDPDPNKDIGPDSLSGLSLDSFEFVQRGYGGPVGSTWNGSCEDQPKP
jgi:hypothetical protein